MMPRLAALSSAEIRSRICSASGLAAPRTRLCSVRKRVRTLRFWLARANDCRERFAADLVLAMVYYRKFTGRGRSRRPSKCQDVDLESGTRTGRDLSLGRISFWSGSRSVKTVNFGVGHLRSFRQSILNNLNGSAERKLVVKCGHVARSHADAAEAGWPANRSLLVSSVNVNAALESMRVRDLQSTQPDNARHHRIAAGSIRRQNLAGPATIMKDGSKRSVVADFLRNLQ